MQLADLTDLQKLILEQAAEPAYGGRFVNGKILISIRKLEAAGLLTIEDMGSMRGRGMNTERWLAKATPAGATLAAEIKAQRKAADER